MVISVNYISSEIRLDFMPIQFEDDISGEILEAIASV